MTSLRDEWERVAEEWARWARAPGHDSYWRFHRDRFLALLPPPGRLTVDVGCGEGRLGRDLTPLGHRVVGVDGSPTLARLAATHPGGGPVALGDAARLPLRDGAADLVIAFMSLQDVDDLDAAVAEAARVVAVGGRVCLAVVHPLNSAGAFAGGAGGAGGRDDPAAPFVVGGSYFEVRRTVDRVERDGLRMAFHSEHRPLERYSRALEAAGLLVEAIREVGDDDPTSRWHRMPLFLHLRARR